MKKKQPKEALIKVLNNKDKEAKYFVDLDGQNLIVIGNVDISGRQLEKLPVKFAVVTGKFDCSDNSLTTLANGPTVIGGDFVCDNNRLSNLEVHPVVVGGRFSCRGNSELNNWLVGQLGEINCQELDWDIVCSTISIDSSKRLRDLSDKTGIFDI